MLFVYVNYPKPQFTVHRNPACYFIRRYGKKGQRRFAVTEATQAQIVKDLAEGKIRFASRTAIIDLWLDISLDTPEAEQALVKQVHTILGQRYARLARAELKRPHCR